MEEGAGAPGLSASQGTLEAPRSSSGGVSPEFL